MEGLIVYLVNIYFQGRDCSGHKSIRNKVFRKRNEAYKALKEVCVCYSNPNIKIQKNGDMCYKIFKPGKIKDRSIEDIMNGVPYRTKREYIGEAFIIKMEVV